MPNRVFGMNSSVCVAQHTFRSAVSSLSPSLSASLSVPIVNSFKNARNFCFLFIYYHMVHWYICRIVMRSLTVCTSIVRIVCTDANTHTIGEGTRFNYCCRFAFKFMVNLVQAAPVLTVIYLLTANYGVSKNIYVCVCMCALSATIMPENDKSRCT